MQLLAVVQHVGLVVMNELFVVLSYFLRNWLVTIAFGMLALLNDLLQRINFLIFPVLVMIVQELVPFQARTYAFSEPFIDFDRVEDLFSHVRLCVYVAVLIVTNRQVEFLNELVHHLVGHENLVIV